MRLMRPAKCSCGLSYDAFRCGYTYRDAYHEVAWSREHTSRKAVLGHLGRVKRQEWQRHLDCCGLEVEVGEFGDTALADLMAAEFDVDVSFDFGAAQMPLVRVPRPCEVMGSNWKWVD